MDDEKGVSQPNRDLFDEFPSGDPPGFSHLYSSTRMQRSLDAQGGTSTARRRRSDEYDEVEDGVTLSFVGKIVTNVTVFYSPDTEEVRRVIRSANATIDAVGTLLQLFECIANLQCRLQNNTAEECTQRTRGASAQSAPFGINLNIWYALSIAFRSDMRSAFSIVNPCLEATPLATAFERPSSVRLNNFPPQARISE